MPRNGSQYTYVLVLVLYINFPTALCVRKILSTYIHSDLDMAAVAVGGLGWAGLLARRHCRPGYVMLCLLRHGTGKV